MQPPVTVALIGLQSAMYYAPRAFDGFTGPGASLSRVDQVCMLPAQMFEATAKMASFGVVTTEFWRRAVLSILVHADDLHLYWNMASLLSKGASLEASLGSVGFGLTTVCLACITQAVYLAAAIAFSAGPAWLDVWGVCCVGFSGVLFAYKVVLDAGDPTGGWRSIMGMQVPVAWAAWGELIIASMLNPRASFVGHLSGIVAGHIWLLCGGPERLLEGLRSAGVGVQDGRAGLFWGAGGVRAAAAARGQPAPPMHTDLNGVWRALGLGTWGTGFVAPAPAHQGRGAGRGGAGWQDWGAGAVGGTNVAADEALARALQAEEDRLAS